MTGSGLDIDGDALTYAWIQHSGPRVMLAGADTPTIQFLAPEVPTDIEFDLTVTDPLGASHTDRIKLRY